MNFTTKGAMQRLSCTRQTLIRRANRGEIVAVRGVAPTTLYPCSSVDRYLRVHGVER